MSRINPSDAAEGLTGMDQGCCTGLLAPPAACLFDLDGLLLDTEPLHGRGWSEAAAHFGASLSKEQLLQLKGRRRLDCAAQVDGWLPSPVGIEALLAVQQPIVRALLPGAQAMPFAQKLVEHCDTSGIPMALVTSSSLDAVAFKTAAHPWLDCIQLRVHGDDPELRAGKPDPEPFLLAAQRLAVNASDCWAMEDSRAGTASALAAGCQVWVLSAEPCTADRQGNPRTVDSLGVVLDQLISVSTSG